MRRAILTLAVLACTAAAAHAQQRPLVTQDPETVGTGHLLVETGLTWSHDRTFTQSGLTGNLFEFPQIGLSFGVGAIAEIQIDGGLYRRLTITQREDAPLSGDLTFTGDTTSAVDDIVVGAKVRFVPENGHRPGIGIRMVTRLPNASNESGLGLDTMDFFATLLFGKTVGSTRFVANLGLGVLSNPTLYSRQIQVVPYGISLARAVRKDVDVVGEINGQAQFARESPPPGTESRAVFRLGARYTHGAGRVDAGLLIGTTKTDPGIGVTIGYTHVFNAFTVP
jgi:hypothetical protein